MRVLFALLISLPALAQSPREQAQGLNKEGVALLEIGEWEMAWHKFRAAYELYPSPKLRFNIGEALRRINRPCEAIEAYEGFLKDVPADVSADVVDGAKTHVSTLRARVGAITVEGPVGTAVSVDGLSYGTTPLEPVCARVGAHTVTLTLPGGRAVDLPADVGPGKTVVIEAPPPGETPPGPTPWYKRWYVLSGAGALIVGGVVTGVVLATREDPIPKGDIILDWRE